MIGRKTGEPVPVILVTGFLGSGKTTLLQRVLNLPQLGHTAVIINEFGEIGIDHHLVRQVTENVVLLPNGCLCCKVRDDLGVAMRELYHASQYGTSRTLERLIIETTGLADPVPIVHTLMTDPVVDQAYRLQAIVTVVDAITGERNLASSEESVRQVAIADRLIITKSDIANGSPTALAARLARLNPSAPIEDSQSPAFDLFGVFSDRSGDFAREHTRLRSWINEAAYPAAHGHHHHKGGAHGNDVIAACITFEEAIDWTAFTVWLTMLLHSHGANLLRIKGLLNIEGQPGPVIFQGVQHIVSPPVHLRDWPDEDRRSRLVFITRCIDPKGLKESLLAFLQAARVSGECKSLVSRAVPMGIGTEIEGRPFRRASGLSWMK
jgi:G3E family GTPase